MSETEWCMIFHALLFHRLKIRLPINRSTLYMHRYISIIRRLKSNYLNSFSTPIDSFGPRNKYTRWRRKLCIGIWVSSIAIFTLFCHIVFWNIVQKRNKYHIYFCLQLCMYLYPFTTKWKNSKISYVTSIHTYVCMHKYM